MEEDPLPLTHYSAHRIHTLSHTHTLTHTHTHTVLTMHSSGPPPCPSPDMVHTVSLLRPASYSTVLHSVSSQSQTQGRKQAASSFRLCPTFFPGLLMTMTIALHVRPHVRAHHHVVLCSTSLPATCPSSRILLLASCPPRSHHDRETLGTRRLGRPTRPHAHTPHFFNHAARAASWAGVGESQLLMLPERVHQSYLRPRSDQNTPVSQFQQFP